MKGTFVAIKGDIKLVTNSGSVILMDEFVAKLLNEAYENKEILKENKE